MEIPTPPQAVAALAEFVRGRLSDVSGTLAPLWGRGDGVEVLSGRGPGLPDRSVLGAARQLALVIVGAAAPLAPTSYSRARLIRQMHASGLLTDEHVRRARTILELTAEPETPSDGKDRLGAPRADARPVTGPC